MKGTPACSPTSETLAYGLAAADLELDRLLTSFDVVYWRVRQPRTGLTLAERVAHLTELNAIARRAALGRATADQLHAAPRPKSAITGRPAVLLRNWRRSCAELQAAASSVTDAGVRDWLEHYCQQLRDLEQEFARWYAQWSIHTANL